MKRKSFIASVLSMIPLAFFAIKKEEHKFASVCPSCGEPGWPKDGKFKCKSCGAAYEFRGSRKDI